MDMNSGESFRRNIEFWDIISEKYLFRVLNLIKFLILVPWVPDSLESVAPRVKYRWLNF